MESTAPNVAGPVTCWNMHRVADWIERGCKPEDQMNLDIYALRAMAHGKLIELDETGDAISATLTVAGRFEAARLVAHPPAPPETPVAAPAPV